VDDTSQGPLRGVVSCFSARYGARTGASFSGRMWLSDDTQLTVAYHGSLRIFHRHHQLLDTVRLNSFPPLSLNPAGSLSPCMDTHAGTKILLHTITTLILRYPISALLNYWRNYRNEHSLSWRSLLFSIFLRLVPIYPLTPNQPRRLRDQLDGLRRCTAIHSCLSSRLRKSRLSFESSSSEDQCCVENIECIGCKQVRLLNLTFAGRCPCSLSSRAFNLRLCLVCVEGVFVAMFCFAKF